MIFQPENNIGESFRPAGLIFCGDLPFFCRSRTWPAWVACTRSQPHLRFCLYAGGVRHDPRWVKLLPCATFQSWHCRVSIISWGRWIKPRDQYTASFSEKTLRKRAIVALDACYFLHKAISISLSRFGDNRRCGLSDFKRRFPASQKILCTVWFICIFFISEWKRSVVHTPGFV